MGVPFFYICIKLIRSHHLVCAFVSCLAHNLQHKIPPHDALTQEIQILQIYFISPNYLIYALYGNGKSNYFEHRTTGMPIMNNTITNTTHTQGHLWQHTQFCDDTFFGPTKLTSKIQYVHNQTLGLLHPAVRQCRTQHIM